jgi:hypothetical protein
MAWRYIVQRALSDEFLHWDLPIDVSSLRWDLSGPGSLKGAISPDLGNLRDPEGRLILEPWGTYLFAEESGSIRWGGIVQRSAFSGASWAVEAAGFTSYPHGVPFLGKIKVRDADPADLYRLIWDEVQSYPEGDLGLKVAGTKTNSRIGSEEEPYRLDWTEAKDSGDELVALSEDGRFDYRETHAWGEGDEIRHNVEIGYPRLGRKRTDLAFVQGDNLLSVVEPEREEDFANEVFGIGAGEGRKARRTRTPIRDGRLRRPIVYTDKGERSEKRLERRSKAELARHRPRLGIEKITVRDHPNAQIGSWSVGDDVLVQADLPWLGDYVGWNRITGWELTGEGTAVLDLAPSESFTYGG